MFFRLPKAFMLNFLSEWLHIADVGRLDTAMTTESLRPTFLQLLQDIRSTTAHGPKVFQNLPSVTVAGHTISEHGKGLRSFTFLTWLSNRRIYVDEINLWPLGSASIAENVKLPFLRKLSVSGPVSESDVIALVKTSPALQTIHLSFFTRVNEVLREIGDHCPLLEELMLHCSFSMDDFLYLLSKCFSMRSVTLNYDPFKEWAGDNWERLHPYGHLIEHIQIHANAPNHPAFADFIGACPNLRSLGYWDVPETSEGEILLRAAQTCPLLEDLTFDTHSPAALVALGQNCKKLREVRIAHRSQSFSTSDLTILKQVENLEILALEQNDLTNGHLAVICDYRNLKELEMRQCYFEDVVTYMFVDTPISRSLETIRIISRAPAAALWCLTPCSNLREIDLNDCRCDDASLKILATHFPLLKQITMGYVKERIVGLTLFFAQRKGLEEVMFIVHNLHDLANAGFLNFLTDLANYFPHIHFDYEDIASA